MMNIPKGCIEAARDLGVKKVREAEPEVGSYLEESRFEYDNKTGELAQVSVALTDWRCWIRYQELQALSERSVEEIADILVGWSRDATRGNRILAPDNPL